MRSFLIPLTLFLHIEFYNPYISPIRYAAVLIASATNYARIGWRAGDFAINPATLISDGFPPNVDAERHCLATGHYFSTLHPPYLPQEE